LTNFRGRKFRGEFWLPAHPSIIARGELAIDKDGDVRLSLDGSGELGILIGDPSPRTVFGPIHAGYGYDVTLFDAFTRYSSTRRIGAEKAISIAAELVSNGALIGHHIAGLDEPQAGKLILPIATTYKPSQIKEAIKTVSVVARFYWTFGGGAGCHHNKIGGQCLRWGTGAVVLAPSSVVRWVKQKFRRSKTRISYLVREVISCAEEGFLVLSNKGTTW
jgi:hypothetical protein